MNSFVTHMSDQWNNLDEDIEYIGGLQEFVHHLKKMTKNTKPLLHQRKENQRPPHQNAHEMYFLVTDLYKMTIIDSPKCDCGYENEDAYHYFFQCLNYGQQCRRFLE